MTIIGVSPDPQQLLRPGEVVRFRVKVRASLNRADLGFIALVIQDNQGNSLNGGGPSPRMFLPRGTEVIELFGEATIPVGARSVNLFVPLFHDGATRSAVTDDVQFDVVTMK